MPRVRVYVADDHPIYREGLVRALNRRQEFEVVGQSAEGRAALRELRDLRPDVAVLDLRMPGLDGVGILRSLKQEGIATRVVLISAFAERDLVYQAMATGAAGYLVKDVERDEIGDVVAAVARGETRLPPRVQSQLLDEIQARAVDTRSSLTPREHQILELTADGLSAPDIGRQLHLSSATVKSHLQHLYEKLGVSDRAAAVAEAMRRELLR